MQCGAKALRKAGRNAAADPSSPGKPDHGNADGDRGDPGDTQEPVGLFAHITRHTLGDQREAAIEQPLENEEQPYGIQKIRHGLTRPYCGAGAGAAGAAAGGVDPLTGGSLPPASWK